MSHSLIISHILLIVFNWIESKPPGGWALQTFGVCLWSQQLDLIYGAFGVCRFHQTILNYQTCFTLFDLMFSVSHFNFILHVRLFPTFHHYCFFSCFLASGSKAGNFEVAIERTAYCPMCSAFISSSCRWSFPGGRPDGFLCRHAITTRRRWNQWRASGGIRTERLATW